jgi:lipopolysaccharide export system permease protein
VIEVNRRLVSPLLAPAYTILALAFLLLGRFDRRGQSWRIISSIASVVVIQGFYMASLNLARRSDLGLAMMYGFVLLPLLGGLFMLGQAGEGLRGRLAYTGQSRGPA